MNLKNYYYYFQSALTPRICDDIVQYGKAHNPEMAVTGGFGREDNKENFKVDVSLKESIGALNRIVDEVNLNIKGVKNNQQLQQLFVDEVEGVGRISADIAEADIIAFFLFYDEFKNVKIQEDKRVLDFCGINSYL